MPVGLPIKDSRQTGVRLIYFLALAVSLVLTFRLFGFSYFWMDDFNNLYWAQRTGAGEIFWSNLNPFSAAFRPTGMAAYWGLWRLAGLSALPYHLLAWALHSLNVLLTYLLLKEILGSRYAAACGAMLYVFQAAYFEVFWSFGTIFELLSGFLLFLGLWIYLRHGDSMKGVVWASVVYILTVKAKEMAVILPLLWLWYEVVAGKSSLLRPGREKQTPAQERIAALWPVLKRLAIPFAIALWFVYLKVSTTAGMITSLPYNPEFPYYRDFSWQGLSETCGWYFDALTTLSLGTAWAAILVVAAAILLLAKERLGLFFLGYTVIALLPVLPFPNHPFAFFWYLPFFGVCGLAAVLVKRFLDWTENWTARRLRSRWAMVAGALVFLLASGGHFAWQEQRSRPAREWAAGVAAEYRNFIAGLQRLPSPPPGETLYYDSIPQYLDETSVLAASQIAFRRTDLKVRVVTEFPSEASYRIRFSNPDVSQVQAGDATEAGRNE